MKKIFRRAPPPVAPIGAGGHLTPLGSGEGLALRHLNLEVGLALVGVVRHLILKAQSAHQSGNVLVAVTFQFGDSLDEVGTGETLVGIVPHEAENGSLDDFILLLLGSQLLGAGVLLVQLGNHALELVDNLAGGIGQMVDSVGQSGTVSNLGSSHSINLHFSW